MYRIYTLVLVLGTTCITAFTQCPASNKLYVDSSRATGGNGSSWATAYKELRDALAVAAQCTTIDSILVAKGTYKPTSDNNRDSGFVLRGGLKLYGGYGTGGSARNLMMNPTILSGNIGALNDSTDNSYHILIAVGIPSATDSLVVDGFTITRGNANGGGGKTYNGKYVPQNYGGGIHSFYAEGKTALRNCIFTRNWGTFGGGIYSSNTSITISNCAFSNNNSLDGGGLLNASESASINNCVFSGNGASVVGGGIYNNSASSAITNCAFFNNISGGDGGGVYNQVSPSVITGCTFYANSCSRYGGAIYNGGYSHTITNSIIWGNTAGTGPGIYSVGNFIMLSVTYSLVQDGNSGTGNLNTDPLFVNAGNIAGADALFGTADDGLRLQMASPAVDAGNNAAIPAGTTTDFTGAARLQGNAVDMGAYESFTCFAYNKLYVDSSRATNGNGSSWATAFKNLKDALTVANQCSNIDTILVAKGTYYPTGGTLTATALSPRDTSFSILRGQLKIYGGYPSGGGARSLAANPVILSGDIGTLNDNTDNSYHVVIMANIADLDSLVFDGFKITGGNANGSTGVTYNQQTAFQNDAGGLGLYTASSKTSIRNCAIYNNNSSGNGGGMYTTTTNSYAPGHRFVTLTNCVFTGNHANNGGALYVTTNIYPTVYIANCTLTGNSSSNGGGALTIWYSSAVVTNSIIWGNTTTGNTANIFSQGSYNNYDYSLVQGGQAGTGNLDTDPAFVNISSPAGPDNIWGTSDDGLRLQPFSLAANGGSNLAVTAGTATDITGGVRIQGDSVDMGAYEGFTCIAANKIYVDSSRATSGDGNSWATAFKEVRDALITAKNCGNADTIFVAKGTYTPTGGSSREVSFRLPRNGIRLYGGYASGGGSRNFTANPTILTGNIGNRADATDNSYHVLLVVATPSARIDSTTRIDGFTITGGYASSNSTFTVSTQTLYHDIGGGIYCYGQGAGNSCRPLIANCIFYGNRANNRGGAIFNEGYNGGNSSPTIVNCVFFNNNAGYTGGSGNDYGGGAVCNNANAGTSTPSIINCSFYGNNANGGAGGAVYNYGSGAIPTITNSIIYLNSNNSGNNNVDNVNGATFNISYSIVQGGPGGSGNINANPLFVDAAAGNLRLQQCSPAINTGNAAALPGGITTDVTGAARIFNATVDMGAYECTLLPTTFTFKGAGNWNTVGNWQCNWVPPLPLPSASEIVIDPVGGDCILNVPFTVGNGGKLTVKTGKKLVVQGNVQIQ